MSRSCTSARRRGRCGPGGSQQEGGYGARPGVLLGKRGRGRVSQNILFLFSGEGSWRDILACVPGVQLSVFQYQAGQVSFFGGKELLVFPPAEHSGKLIIQSTSPPLLKPVPRNLVAFQLASVFQLASSTTKFDRMPILAKVCCCGRFELKRTRQQRIFRTAVSLSWCLPDIPQPSSSPAARQLQLSSVPRPFLACFMHMVSSPTELLEYYSGAGKKTKFSVRHSTVKGELLLVECVLSRVIFLRCLMLHPRPTCPVPSLHQR